MPGRLTSFPPLLSRPSQRAAPVEASQQTVVTMAENFDDYPEARPADTALDMVKGLAGSSFPGAGALATLIQTSHSRRLEAFHRRTAERLRALESASASSLFHRAMVGDEDTQEAILSTKRHRESGICTLVIID